MNKDDLREMLHTSKYSSSREKFILIVRDTIIELALADNTSVISDDTNFNDEHIETMSEIAKKFGAKVTVKDFNISPTVCIARNRLREKAVPEAVIWQMHNNHAKKLWGEGIIPDEGETPKKLLQDKTLPEAIVVDLDGTLALHTNRGPFEYHKCHTDEVNEPVLACIHAMMADGFKLIFVSGREDTCMDLTKTWLANKCGLLAEDKDYELYMRKAKDFRKDSVVKEEIYRELIKRNFIKFVLDDRQQVVDHLRSLGFTVFQVAPNKF